MKWTIDPSHANIGFAVKHMAIATVKGSFKRFDARGETDAAGFPTALEMSIDAGSIDTNNDQRDGHLRSPDFFDAAAHPQLTFSSREISGTPDALKIVGDLSIRGTTKPVTLTGTLAMPIKDPYGNTRTSLEVSGRISRAEWGLTWNQALEFGGLMVSDDVRLSIEAEAVAQAA